MTIGQTVNDLLRRFDLEVRRVRPSSAVPKPKRDQPLRLDDEYDRVYDQGLERSGTHAGRTRRARFYNVAQAVELTRRANGLVAECGTWRGLSAYVICHYLRREDDDFRGDGVHIFDSFEGLSVGRDEDRSFAANGDPDGELPPPGKFEASPDHVRHTLAEFPDVALHKGWIPESLEHAPTGPYRLVHLDLDLYEPTRGAVRFFHPLLAPGGAILCDDYYSRPFPGVQKAVDEYCDEADVPVLRLSTGQAVLCARA